MSDSKFSWVNVKNNWNWDNLFKVRTSAKTTYKPDQGWTTPDVELAKVGVDVGIEILKRETGYGNGLGKLTLTGPSAGLDVGAKSGIQQSGVSAMAELSAVKGEATLGPLYVSAGLNANTGVKLGTGGFQAGILGFGLTLGVGGRWTIDTPFGSAGACGGMGAVRQENRNMATNESPQLVAIYK